MRRPRSWSFALLLAGALGCRRTEETVRADPATSAVPSSVASSAPAPTSIPLEPVDHSKTTNVLSVAIDAKGALFLGGKPITRADLESATRAALGKDPDLRVAIAADTHVEHGKVIALLDLLRAVGVTKIGCGVQKPSDAGTP